MELYHYTTLESFFKMLSGAGESGFLGMELSNFMYSKDASGEPYGLSILRKAIGMYELNHQIPAESSKVEVPFLEMTAGCWSAPNKRCISIRLPSVRIQCLGGKQQGKVPYRWL